MYRSADHVIADVSYSMPYKCDISFSKSCEYWCIIQ